jgi:hypothetical protein
VGYAFVSKFEYILIMVIGLGLAAFAFKTVVDKLPVGVEVAFGLNVRWILKWSEIVLALH